LVGFLVGMVGAGVGFDVIFMVGSSVGVPGTGVGLGVGVEEGTNVGLLVGGEVGPRTHREQERGHNCASLEQSHIPCAPRKLSSIWS
jgi:hypothetical protein